MGCTKEWIVDGVGSLNKLNAKDSKLLKHEEVSCHQQCHGALTNDKEGKAHINKAFEFAESAADA